MRRIIKNNFLMLKYIYQARPSHIVVTLLNSILSSLVSLYSIIMVGNVVDSVMQNGNIRTVVVILLIFAIVQIVYAYLNSWLNSVVIPHNTQIIHEKMQLELLKKSSKMKYACFEDSDFYNKYHIAIQQSDKRALAVLSSFSSMVGSFIGIASLISLMSAVDLSSIIIVSMNVVISIVLNTKSARVQKKFLIENAPQERLMTYVESIFTGKESSKDIRAFHYFPELLFDIFANASQTIKRLIWKFGKLFCKISKAQSINGTVSYVMIMCLFAYKVSISQIKISEFIILINASQKLIQQTKDFFNVIPQFYEHSIYIESYLDFVEAVPMAEENASGLSFPKNPSIELRKIDFCYPGSSKMILNNVTISIPYPSKVAFVGLNGAGKSTIVKLILKLYDPIGGQILVNGLDYSEYNLISARESISAVFQDYQIYDMSIAENILMRSLSNKEDDRLVKEALKFVGLYEKTMSLPEGINTILSKKFSSTGTLFSGGEQQKLAIARAYVKNYSVMIMDEPSSALDPIAERSILDAMYSLSEQKSMIIVSHKLSNVKYADKIYVIEDGSVIEEGNHQELLTKNSVYAKLYHEQASKY